MTEPVDIKGLIQAAIPDAQVYVQGEACNARVVVISAAFEGQSLLAQQRLVNEAVAEKIADGTIHALSIKSYTPSQWEAVPNKQEVTGA